MDYNWTGNVRELENAIEYAFVVCPDGKSIAPEYLPEEIRQPHPHSPWHPHDTMATHPRPGRARISASSRSVLADAEQLLQLLRECDYNKAEVARRLDVSRTLIWKWLKTHKVPLDHRGT